MWVFLCRQVGRRLALVARHQLQPAVLAAGAAVPLPDQRQLHQSQRVSADREVVTAAAPIAGRALVASF